MNKYTTVSITKPLANDVKALMKRVGHWPSLTAFTREAVLEKYRIEIDREREVNETAN